MSRYRAVIFDFGGVITTSPMSGMRRYCEGAGIAWEDLRWLIAAGDGAWSRYETNAISTDEFVDAIEAEAAAAGMTMNGRAFLDSFYNGMSVRPEMVAVVRALRGLPELRVGCITNNLRNEGERNPLFDDLFEIVVESSKTGLRKPDPRIYRLACDLLGVQPEQAIFLDDLGVNLKAARELGMATIKVDDSPTVIDELERLIGLPLPHPEAGTAAESSQQ